MIVTLANSCRRATVDQVKVKESRLSDLSPVIGCGHQCRGYVDRRDNRINHHVKEKQDGMSKRTFLQNKSGST